MANVVEIVIKGNDQSSQVMERAAGSTKRLANDMKALGGTVGQVGNAFSILGRSDIAQALGAIESAVIATRGFTKDLGQSKLAVAGLGVAAITAGYQIGEFVRSWIPFFNFHDKMEAHIDQMSKVEQITNEIIAKRDPDLAQQREEIRLIDERIEANRRLQETLGNKIGGTGGLEQIGSSLQKLRQETIDANARKAEEKEIEEFEKSWARWDTYGNGIIERLQELSNAELAELQKVDQAFDRRGAELLDFYANQIISDEQFFLMEGALFEVHQKEMTKVEKDQSDKRMAILDAEKKKRLQSLSTYMSSSASIFGSLATLIETTGKKNFELAQGFRYAEAVVNTAAGIARALADYQWPLSIVVGAAVAAAGAAQIATIAAAKPPQAHGGASYIPSESTYLLNKGERVLSPRQNEDLTSFMRSGGGGGTIMIDGRRLGEELHSMSRDGRLKIDGRAIV